MSHYYRLDEEAAIVTQMLILSLATGDLHGQNS